MNKLFLNKLFINLLSGFLLIAIFVFLLLRLKYALVVNDDMSDLITNDFAFYHGRFVTELISLLFVKIIPSALGINIQDFAIVSEGCLKAVVFSYLIYMLGNCLNKFSKRSYLLSFGIILSFLSVFSILISIDFVWAFDMNQFFFGYIGCLIFFFWFCKKIFDMYLDENSNDFYCSKLSRKNIFVLFMYSLFVATSNELLTIASIVILIMLLLEKLFIFYKTKIKPDISYILFSLVCIIPFSTIAFMSDGSKVLWESYALKVDFSSLYGGFLTFSKLFLKYIVLDNIHFILPMIFCMIILCRRNSDKTRKILKFSIYSNLGFLLFLYGTIFLSLTCIHTKETHKYWFLHPGLLADYSVFLFALLLILLSYLLSLDENKKLKVLVVVLSVLSCSLFIVKNFSFDKIKCLHSYKGIRTAMYMNDKISLSYLKSGKTIVLPKEQFFYILPDTSPQELSSNSEIWSKIYDKERARYLIYLERNYGVNVEPGITFLPYQEAIEEFKKNGGTINKEEMKKLNFSRLNKFVEN